MKSFFYKYAPILLVLLALSLWAAAFAVRYLAQITHAVIWLPLVIGQLYINIMCGLYIRRMHQQTHISRNVINILNELPIAIKTYDENNKLGFVNRKAEELLGYKLDELVGLTPVEIAKMFWKDSDEALYNQLNKSRKPVLHRIRTIVNSYKAEITITVSVHKLDNGGLLYLFADAKEEQQFKNLQIQTKTILEAVDNLVVLADTNNRIVSVNKAFEEIVGRKAEAVLGKSLGVLEELQITLDDSQRPADEHVSPFELSFQAAGGVQTDLLLNVAPMFNVNNELIGTVIVGANITALKSERSKVQQQEKLALLGQMASGIVHEIRNPLTTISGFCQLISAKLTDSKQQEYFGLVEESVQDINKVVSDFLAFAKPRPPVFGSLSINHLIKSMEFLFLSQGMYGFELKLRLSPTEREVTVDENQIKQVLLNIVNNAIQAVQATERPCIAISTELRERENQMVIRISDNGEGMTKEQRDQVGTPFFTTKAKGTGLGLSICYQIMKDHHGMIEVETEPGVGTTFIIILPCD